jgi:hypothetical protein
MSARPKHQRWIKRPPRPSRTGAAKPERRDKPGMTQFVLAVGFGLAVGILGGVVGPQLIPDRPGMGGLFAGLGAVIGFMALWRGFGGTRQDIKDLFR